MGNIFQISAIIAFVVNTGLGILVFFMNPQRRTNRFFLLTSFTLAIWLAMLAYISISTSPRTLTLWIRNATAVSCFFLPTFDLLRMGIMHPDGKRRVFLTNSIPWLVMLACVLPGVYHPAFITDVKFSPSGFPRPIYGWAQGVYVAYFLCALGLLTWRFTRNLRRTRDIQRQELEFTVLAYAGAGAGGILLGQILPSLTPFTDAPQLLPLDAIILVAVMAYGIATRRIMSVSDVLRRSTSYALLVGYMVVLYLSVMFASQWVFSSFLSDPATIAHMLAAIVVAFSLAPAHGRSQEFASRLFGNVEKMDVRKTVRSVQDALSQIGPLDDLTQRFGDIIRSAAGTDRLFLLMSRNGAYEQVYPENADAPPCRIPAGDALIDLVTHENGPVTVDTMTRMRPTPQRTAAIGSLRKLDSNLAVGVHSKEQMGLLMLLGRRLSGKIYGPEEQDALQIVCNQFGVAFENAKLYTELQDSKIYNDILVDSLVSGIVAVHSDGMVSVFNREAQRITGIEAEKIIDAPMTELPAPLVASFKETLASSSEIMDKELTIERDNGEEIPIRLSCSVFHSHTGTSLGVLGVFSDLTLLKKLEDQVRRSDRLSSIGTLAAGMAHEIKNPLVSISTFTQLLPERYEEEDFRNTFSRLIGKEVKRIDSIVSRLLKFSRPAKPFLQSIHLHDALDDSLNLISQQLHRKNIKLARNFDSSNDLVNGDVDLLSQAFINFFLNAIESMDDGGTLTVSTAEIRSRWYASRNSARGSRIRLSIVDTGCGIPAKDVSKIFDPFFTSKSTGTGLGLSVSHSIIDEHDATLEVETAEGKGTTFHILFPLLTEKEDTQ